MKYKKIKIIFLTRNGLLEPLGQSQIMNYLRGLSKDYSIKIISYEKYKDLNNKVAMARTIADCKTNGISWQPQLFKPHVRNISSALNIFKMILIVWKEVHNKDISLIHARSYVPAIIALIINKLTKIPFIFDMRALWPEELINSGRISRGTFMHRLILNAERACLKKSSTVISLTNAGTDHLKSIYPNEMKTQNIVVIPTCADLERFSPSKNKTPNKIVHGCTGTILSSWFLINWLANWIHFSAFRDPNSIFEIVTQDDPITIRSMIDPTKKLSERLKIYSETYENMPNVLKGHDLSIMFFSQGLSKLGSSPTRMAEALGTGIPVIVNEGVGDVANIIKKNNVGVVVEGEGKIHMERAFDSFLNLIEDPDLISRCRMTAVSLFSLEFGTEEYRKIYKKLILDKGNKCVV